MSIAQTNSLAGLTPPTFVVPAAVNPRLEHPYGTFDAEESPFTRGPKERPLRLFADTAELPDDDDALALLLEMGHHDDVELTTTTDVGHDTITFERSRTTTSSGLERCVRASGATTPVYATPAAG